MNNLFKVIILVLALVLGYWTWNTLFPKPEQVIRNRLNKLAHYATFPANEGNIARVAKIQAMGRLFADNVQIKVDVPGVDSETFTSREELMQYAMAAKQVTGGLKTEFLDINVDLRDNGMSASVDLTLNAKAGAENDPIVQELKLTMKKIDGDWLITRVEPLKPLKP